MATKIQVRRDTAANWTSEDPTLAIGEIGYETDTGKFKIGNGSDEWTALAYSKDQALLTTSSPTFADITDSGLTASEIVASNADKKLVSLAVATYPSLAELAYVKGVTSAIQTQLGTVGMTLVATANPSAAADFTISGLTSGVKYYLDMEMTQNTSAGYYKVQFNADTGNNYKWVYIKFTTNTGNVLGYSNAGYGWIVITGNATPAAGDFFKGNVSFVNNSGNAVVGFFNGYAADTVMYASGGFRYAGAATLSSVTVSTTAGTMSGVAKLYRLN
jgi:hypothetical protein